MPSFASHANESRALQVLWWRRRMKRVMRGESENVGDILVKERKENENVTDLRSGGMEGTLFI